MLRKIFSSLLLVIFLTNSINSVFAVSVEASVGDINYQITASKDAIRKMKNGSKYILQLNKIDKFINSQSDLQLLGKIKTKLDEKKDLASGKDELTYELLNYIGLVVNKKIDQLETIEGADIIKQLNNNSLTTEETKKVEDEIVKLQINLLDSSKTFVDKLLSDLKKSVNVEKTGNLKLNIEGSGAMFGSTKGELSLTNMKSRNANFDSEFESQVDLLAKASIAGGTEINTQFSSFVNFISKDGNIYLLLQKLKYSGLDNIDSTGEISSLLDKIKTMGENNEYLKIEDNNSAMVLNMIKNFDINSIYSEANKVLSNPMLKPYKKEGDKYLLAPTKDFCNTIKYISYKINSYGSYTCSDKEYNDMLKEAVVGGNLYIIVDGTDKHLGFESNQYGVDGSMKIYYSDKKIEQFLLKGEITKGIDKGNMMEVTYINGQKLDIVVSGKNNQGSTILSFKSLLTSDNKFSKIDYIWNFSDGNEGFNSSFILDKNKFSGKFVLVGNEEVSFSGTISGELNNESTLSAIDLKISSMSNSQKFNYDYETGKSSYTPMKTTFDLNYSLKNEIITGTISMKVDNQELFSVKSNGKYKKEYFELNNVLIGTDSTNTEKINGNINTKFVGNLEKNNFDLYIDFSSKEGTFKINLTSDGKVEYKDGIKIKAPTNYKSVGDLTGNSSEILAPETPVNDGSGFFQ